MVDNRPIFVMALPACRGRSIGDNAIRRAQAIADRYRPVIISDSFPDQMPNEIRTIQVNSLKFNWLRRFCHVPNELGFAWAVRQALKRMVLEEKVAFLLCHGYTLAWFTGRWFRRKSGTAFGMFMHGHIFERPKGTYDPRVTAFYRAIAPTCYKEADRLFALSPAQAELAICAGAPEQRVFVTPNGLHLDDIGLERVEVKRKQERLNLHSPLRLLFVGRLSVEKGVDVMLKACARLRDEDVDYHLTIVGTGPEENSLVSLCATLGLDSNVTFAGPRRRHELGPFYLGHDVLLVPSLSEPLGNVVLEGMAGGCLIIGSNTGGIPFMLGDGERGVLTQPGSHIELASCVMSLVQESELYVAKVKAAFSWCADRMSWESIGRIVMDGIAGCAGENSMASRKHG